VSACDPHGRAHGDHKPTTIAQEAMYAVIETGGKQYRVELGSVIQVDRLAVQPGESITIDRVLLVADGDATTVGQPVVDGATVRADVLAGLPG
jgi:large subunit ribosomal protein L21